MEDRIGIILLHETKIALQLILRLLAIYVYIYSSNEKLYYDTCVMRTLITRETFVVLSCVILRATREALGKASPINAVHT